MRSTNLAIDYLATVISIYLTVATYFFYLDSLFQCGYKNFLMYSRKHDNFYCHFQAFASSDIIV